jgi:hypothetical protein
LMHGVNMKKTEMLFTQDGNRRTTWPPTAPNCEAPNSRGITTIDKREKHLF